MTNKKGVSPVIATVLLIAMVVVIGLIVFLWFKGTLQESITKFGGTNIELICNDVQFDASYSENILSISNTAPVPIYNFQIKVEGDGSHETKNCKNDYDFEGLSQGGIFSKPIIFEAGSTEITLIPILIGTSEKGNRVFACDEKQHGFEIAI